MDDEASQRDLLEVVLSGEGYLVETASGGEEAVKRVEEIFFNLVIMDLKMGTMGGLEALQRIKDVSPAIQVLSAMSMFSPPQPAISASRPPM